MSHVSRAPAEASASGWGPDGALPGRAQGRSPLPGSLFFRFKMAASLLVSAAVGGLWGVFDRPCDLPAPGLGDQWRRCGPICPGDRMKHKKTSRQRREVFCLHGRKASSALPGRVKTLLHLASYRTKRKISSVYNTRAAIRAESARLHPLGRALRQKAAFTAP